MEIEVLGVDGVPPETIVSIRAGASRRQAPVSALSGGVPFRFPTGPKGLNPFKVDLLQPMCSARLALKPEAGLYECPIEGSDIKVKFTITEPGKDAAPVEADSAPTQLPLEPASNKGKWSSAMLPREDDPAFPATAAAVKDYLEQHQLLTFVKALLQTVVRDQPGDPFQFIAEQFSIAAQAAKSGDNAAGSAEGMKQAEGKEEDGVKQEEGPPKEDEASLRQQAQESLQAALAEEEVKARELRQESQVTLQAVLAEDENALKAKAQDGLEAALVSEDEAANALKLDAQESLEAAFVAATDASKQLAEGALKMALASQEEAAEALRASAQESLQSALGADEQKAVARGSSQTTQEMKMAQGALEAALVTTEEDAQTLRLSAREALQAGLTDTENQQRLADAQDQQQPQPPATEDQQPSADTQEKQIAMGALEAALVSTEEDVQALRQSAQEALQGTLLQDEEALKTSAQNGLQAALAGEDRASEALRLDAQQSLQAVLLADGAADLGVPPPEEGLAATEKQAPPNQTIPEDGQALRLKAQETLRDALLRRGEQALVPPPADAVPPDDEMGDASSSTKKALPIRQEVDMRPSIDVEDAKEKAIEALLTLVQECEEAAGATSEDVDADPTGRGMTGMEAEVNEAKEQARDALMALLQKRGSVGTGADEDEEIAGVNGFSQADAQREAAVEEAKEEARLALLGLAGEDSAAADAAGGSVAEAVPGKNGHVQRQLTEKIAEVKLKARDALMTVFKGADDLGIGVEDSKIEMATSQAEASIEEALREEAAEKSMKERARSALRSSLLGGAEEPTSSRAESTLSVPVPTLPPGAGDRKLSFKAEADPTRAAALEAKARLLAAKEELSQLNLTLRTEVAEMNEVLESLLNERRQLSNRYSER